MWQPIETAPKVGNGGPLIVRRYEIAIIACGFLMCAILAAGGLGLI